MPNSNLELLKRVARRLGPLLGEVVFVGGTVAGLLITDEGAAEVRPTYDVDVIAEITSYAGYEIFSERLRELGFREDTSEDAPKCRWLIDSMKLDVMPVEEKILGFTNRWYRDAMLQATEVELEPAVRIRLITAPLFIATKLDAFKGRGRGDYAGSHDLEDLLAVVDGRKGVIQEIADAGEVRSYIGGEVRTLLATPLFIDVLPGFLLLDAASQNRLQILLNRLKEISQF
jgi:hypothetical protein